jgi:hypothetical protein
MQDYNTQDYNTQDYNTQDYNTQDYNTPRSRELSPQQLTAGNKILDTYLNSIYRWVILLAEMQSGKTDTFYFVAAEMLRLGKISNVIVLAGYQDNDLKCQLKDVTSFQNSYRLYMEDVLKMKTEMRNAHEIMVKNSFSVYCGADLDKLFETQSSYKIQDTLFIWDESHYAQNKINRPFKFLENLHISADANSLNFSGKRNNYFLSVSATPYSEISVSIHNHQQKKIVKMEAGADYIGVGTFLRKNLIIPFQPTTWLSTLEKCFAETKYATPKYAIVRIRGNHKMTEAIELATRMGWDYGIYDAKDGSKNKILSLDELEQPPPLGKHKVIFIRGMLRMGKRVSKNHLAFVMETSQRSKTDTILQGLLGRMCGYHKNLDIRIYLSDHISKIKNGTTELEKYVILMESKSGIILTMPQLACNLGPLRTFYSPDYYDPVNENIPTTSNLEAFSSIKKEDGEKGVGPVGMHAPIGTYAPIGTHASIGIHAPIGTYESIEIMQTYLEHMISRIEVNRPRCVISNQVKTNNWQGILLNNEVLKAIEKNGTIYESIKNKFGVKLKITRIRGRKPTQCVILNQTRLSKIEW